LSEVTPEARSLFFIAAVLLNKFEVDFYADFTTLVGAKGKFSFIFAISLRVIKALAYISYSFSSFVALVGISSVSIFLILFFGSGFRSNVFYSVESSNFLFSGLRSIPNPSDSSLCYVMLFISVRPVVIPLSTTELALLLPLSNISYSLTSSALLTIKLFTSSMTDSTYPRVASRST